MKYYKKLKNHLVYSTDQSHLCSGCNQPHVDCRCRTGQRIQRGDGIVRVSRETKGRKGSGVTLITGLELDHTGLKRLAGTLKKKCGSGGAVKNGVIEIQGDHRQLLIAELGKEGYKVKLAGG
ncbi:MAG: translation initiation factor Sui1 [Proteobacteria bacterium]|nr:translation initiation factor Sui1 [Pseudomonadota bacterium]MBU1737790.1 translation initiation factor Sui1 [Pseudomonadota bacterium]